MEKREDLVTGVDGLDTFQVKIRFVYLCKNSCRLMDRKRQIILVAFFQALRNRHWKIQEASRMDGFAFWVFFSSALNSKNNIKNILILWF